tara:strand:- start:94 stop:285 length:192 start_codon:yes stop_codon:yes gene_type:complete
LNIYEQDSDKNVRIDCTGLSKIFSNCREESSRIIEGFYNKFKVEVMKVQKTQDFQNYFQTAEN